MNRKAGLQNAGIICPELKTYLVNTYSLASDLYVAGSDGIKIKSEEGTTQGDTAAMAFYAVSLMKMIKDAKATAPAAKQVFYADDGAAGGRLEDLVEYWKFLQEEGPKYGYFVNPAKTYLIVKADYKEDAETAFQDVNITLEGHRYLGSYIGTKAGTERFVDQQIEQWTKDIDGICNAAEHEPHLAYSAYTYGTSKRWNYLMRTTPSISHKLEGIEEDITSKLIPALVGHQITQDHRAIFTLPVRHGGMAIENPVKIAEREFMNSLKMTEPLWRAIYSTNKKVSGK